MGVLEENCNCWHELKCTLGCLLQDIGPINSTCSCFHTLQDLAGYNHHSLMVSTSFKARQHTSKPKQSASAEVAW